MAKLGATVATPGAGITIGTQIDTSGLTLSPDLVESWTEPATPEANEAAPADVQEPVEASVPEYIWVGNKRFKNPDYKPAAAEPSTAQAATAGLGNLNANLTQTAKPAANSTIPAPPKAAKAATSLTPNVQKQEQDGTIPVGAPSATLSAPVAKRDPSTPVETSGYAQGQSEKPEGSRTSSAVDNAGNRAEAERQRADNLRAQAESRKSVPSNNAKPIRADAPPENRVKVRWSRRTKKQEKSFFERFKDRLEGKSAIPTGNNVITKLVASADADISIRDVSIGSNVLYECLQQDDNTILDQVNKMFGTSFTSEEFANPNNIVKLVMFFNAKDFYVTMTKSPSTSATSYQKRVLRIHPGDGIKVHPLAVKAFNADFDGDDSTLHMDGFHVEEARDAVAYLIGINGDCNLDEEYFVYHKFRSRDAARTYFESAFPSLVIDTDALADAYYDMKDLGEFVRTAWDLTGRNTANMAMLVSDLYDCQMDLYRQSVVFESDSTFAVRKLAEEGMGLSPEEGYVLGIFEGAKQGKMPPNFNQFISELNKFSGDIEGKNADFRITAGLAKLIKRDERTYVGEAGLYDLWHMTSEACMAEAMAAKAFAGTRKVHIKEQTRNKILKDCGLPKDNDLVTFFSNFAKSYNKWKTLENEANVTYDTKLGVNEDSIKKVNFVDVRGNGNHQYGTFVEQFIEIYGDFTLGHLFGDSAVFDGRPNGVKGDSWTSPDNVATISHKYKNMSLREFSYTAHVNYSGSPRKKVLRNTTGSFYNIETKQYEGGAYYDLLMACAESRTGEANAYAKNVSTAMETLREIVSKWDPSNKDAGEQIIDALNLTHPDMFAYFNMDNMLGFVNSVYGQAIISGADLESVRVAMVVEWKLSRINEKMQQLNGATQEEAQQLQEQIAYEWDILGSCSDIWNAIASMEQDPKTGSIVPKLLDLNTSAADKYDMLCKLCATRGVWAHTQPYEVLFQLEHVPANSYATLNLNGWEESHNDPIKSNMDAIKRIGKRLNAEDKVSVLFRNTTYIDELRTNITENPTSFTHIPEAYIIDAILASYNKAYSDSEKSSQQPAIAAIYKALAEQINGGMLDDVYYIDNQMMGIVGWNQISRIDVCNALLFEDKGFRFYDKYGNVGEISRDAFGINNDEDLLEFINAYPAIGDLLIPTCINVEGDSDGNIKNVGSKEGNFITRNANVAVLYDHPGYYALINLFTEAEGRTDLNARRSLAHTKELLDSYLMEGVNIEDPMFKELNDALPDQGLGDLVCSLMLKYAAELGAGRPRKGGFTMRQLGFSFDTASIHGFWGSRQQLCGAKTSTSTGVEGAMTNKHMFLQGWLWSMTDSYIEVDESAEPNMQQALVGYPTADGVPYEPGMKTIVFAPDLIEESDELLDDSDDQIPSVARWFIIKREKSGEDFNLKIKKSGDDGTDSIVKRRKYSAEYNNFLDWEDEQQQEFQEMVSNGADPVIAVEKIRFNLAKRLKDMDASCGYEDMELVEYMNVARMMAVPSENGVVFRSLEQISSAINNIVPLKLPDVYNIKDQYDELFVSNEFLRICRETADKVGMVDMKASPLEAILGVRKPVFYSGKLGMNERQRSNSSERNYSMLDYLYESNSLKPVPEPAMKKESDRIASDVTAFNTSSTTDEVVISLPDNCYWTAAMKPSGLEDKFIQPGNRSHFFIDERCTDEQIDEAIRIASKVGCTAVMSKKTAAYVTKKYPEYTRALNCYRNRTWMLPFFDMALNGYGKSQSGTFTGSTSNIVWHCEDANNRFDYADSSAIGTASFISNIHINDEYVETDLAIDMFADTIKAYDGCRFAFRLASVKEIEQLRTDDTMQVDLRINKANANYDRVLNKYNRLFDEFFNMWDGKSQTVSNSRPDRIVTFMCCQIQDPITGKVSRAYAPVIPFHEGDNAGRTAPATFDCDVSYDPSTGKVVVAAINTANMLDRFVKVHEGFNAANKLVMYGDPVQDHELKNGVKISIFNSKATTASRRNGTDKRLQTFMSAMFMTYADPEYRYNFAEHDLSFPENLKLKERMQSERIPMEEWADLVDGTKFSGDNRINAFVKNMVHKCLEFGINPSDFLANKYYINEETVPANNFYEFQMVLDSSMTWQDEAMHFYSQMCPSLCGDGINGDDTGCLFKTCRDDNWDYGCLQLEVPYYYGGKLCGYTRENVYAAFSFFGDDNSAFKRAGLNGSTIEHQSLLQSIHSGKSRPRAMVQYLQGAMSGWAPNYLKTSGAPAVEIGTK